MNNIEIIGVSKKINDNWVLKDVSLNFKGGVVYGLEGKNGSGKTMLMRVICGLIRATEGVVKINGEVLGKDISFPKSIGVLIENPAFLDSYSGFNNLKLLSSVKKVATEQEITNALLAVGLDPKDKKHYRKYSLGMKQRLGIAAAIMESPDIVLLDEPINAIDDSGVTEIRRIIHAQKLRGAIVIIACHDKEELEYLCDEIYTVNQGKIVNHRELTGCNEKTQS